MEVVTMSSQFTAVTTSNHIKKRKGVLQNENKIAGH